MVYLNSIKEEGTKVAKVIINSYDERIFEDGKKGSSVFKILLKDIYEKVLFDIAEEKVEEFFEKKDYFNEKLGSSLERSSDTEKEIDELREWFLLLNAHVDAKEYIGEHESSVSAYKNSKQGYKKIIKRFLNENEIDVSYITLTDGDIEKVKNVLKDKKIKDDEIDNIVLRYVNEYDGILSKLDVYEQSEYDRLTYHLGADNE